MRFLLILAGALSLTVHPAVLAHAYNYRQDIKVDIVTDDGRILPVHRRHNAGSKGIRAYLEAGYGENYSIRIHNRTGDRIGLVIAVDGRNIISGRKSFLKASEQMYILEPYERASYDGWRTSKKNVHRFYFTDAGDSYAGAWEDYTAMGVIAVAVFPERQYVRTLPLREGKSGGKRDRGFTEK